MILTLKMAVPVMFRLKKHMLRVSHRNAPAHLKTDNHRQPKFFIQSTFYFSANFMLVKRRTGGYW